MYGQVYAKLRAYGLMDEDRESWQILLSGRGSMPADPHKKEETQSKQNDGGYNAC